jgi:selenobiotic family peptide radical SAM maturase
LEIFGVKQLENIYPTCHSILDSDVWDRIMASSASTAEPETLPDLFALHTDELGLPGFLPDLARLEWIVHKVNTGKTGISSEVAKLEVNPTLQLLQLAWKNLALILCAGEEPSTVKPEPGDEFVLVWQDPKTDATKAQAASDEDLLVLKMMVEGIEAEQAAEVGGLPVGAVDAAIDRAAYKGILLRPRSHIRRDPRTFPVGENTHDRFLCSPVFTLQWHITQACDLQCAHCYDRSKRSPLNLEKAFEILDDLRAFCRSRFVKGQVTFTGGNPLLYRHFLELYQGASERGIGIAILGNPAPREQIEELLFIQRPAFFQVSLEGLAEHNDIIRGRGHFESAIHFLKVLRELDIFSMVMLTVTKENMKQVLPLAEMLRDLADSFNFNRLSMVGEGAHLQLPSRDAYAAFLESYIEAAQSNPIMGLKDNLINILHHQKGIELFGGCTGYGCGAAFNFIVALSDGEAHACRKFPSLIGNVFEQSIAEIYDSEIARQYRSGCTACRTCPIRPVCGGCLASAYSHGLNIFEQTDPYCFMTKSVSLGSHMSEV